MGGNWGGGSGGSVAQAVINAGQAANGDLMSRMGDAEASRKYGEDLTRHDWRIGKTPPPRMTMGSNSAVLDSMNKSEGWRKFDVELPDNSEEAFSGSHMAPRKPIDQYVAGAPGSDPYSIFLKKWRA